MRQVRARHGTRSGNVWSCSRYNSNNGWIANGNVGYANGGNLNNRNVAVPLVNYDLRKWFLKRS